MVFITLSPKIRVVPEKFQVDEPLSLAFLALRKHQKFQYELVSKNKHPELRHQQITLC